MGINATGPFPPATDMPDPKLRNKLKVAGYEIIFLMGLIWLAVAAANYMPLQQLLAAAAFLVLLSILWHWNAVNNLDKMTNRYYNYIWKYLMPYPESQAFAKVSLVSEIQSLRGDSMLFVVTLRVISTAMLVGVILKNEVGGVYATDIAKSIFMYGTIAAFMAGALMLLISVGSLERDLKYHDDMMNLLPSNHPAKKAN